jgi:hypothetical protein
MPISKRKPGAQTDARTPAYVVFVCREIVDLEELNTYWQRVNGTLVDHPARVLIDQSRFLILEGQGPVNGVTVYEFPQGMPREVGMTAWPIGRSGNIGKTVRSIW